MKGINGTQHYHLLKALLQLEHLLREDAKDNESLLQAPQYYQELENMHLHYNQLLHELSQQIVAYEALYNLVKVQFLGKKLKELKREISMERPAFSQLVTNIHLVYRT